MATAALTFSCGTAGAGAIECSAEAFHRRIAECNAGCGKSRCADKTIRFDCSDTVIPIAADGTCREDPAKICSSDDECSDRCIAARHRRADRVITCDGLTIDGEDKGVVFRLEPSCEADAKARGEKCGFIEGREWFVVFAASRGTLRGLTLRGFFEGVYTGRDARRPGHFNTIENMVFERGCDDVYTNQQGSEGNVLRDSTIREACHRGVSLKGDAPAGESPGDADFFDSSIIGVTFESAGFNPVNVDRVGRHLLEDVTIHNDRDTGPYRCSGEAIHLFDGSTLYLDNVTIEKGRGRRGCKFGVVTRGEPGVNQLIIRNSRIEDTRVVGVAAALDARLFMSGTTLRNNGGTAAGRDWARRYGGVNVAESAEADLGGGRLTIDGRVMRSAGGNVFENNVMARRCSTTRQRSCVEDAHCPATERCEKGGFPGDVVNDGSNTVTAQGNRWVSGAQRGAVGRVDTGGR